LRSVVVVNYVAISFNYLLTTVLGEISKCRQGIDTSHHLCKQNQAKTAIKNLITLLSEIEKGLKQNSSA